MRGDPPTGQSLRDVIAVDSPALRGVAPLIMLAPFLGLGSLFGFLRGMQSRFLQCYLSYFSGSRWRFRSCS
eukprot:1221332-Pleurochrysis_carterae.AAC.1